MKKLALSVSIFLMPLLVCVATDLVPNISDTVVLGWDSDNTPWWVIISMTGEKTTIDGKEYAVVHGYGQNYDSREWLSYYEMNYRFDGDKVWRYDEAKGEDVLLYDYSLQAGDDFVRPDGSRLVVEKVEEGEVKTLYLHNTETDKEEIWRSDFGSLKSCCLTDGDFGLQYTDILRYGKDWMHEETDKKYLKMFPIEVIQTDEPVGLIYEFDGSKLHVTGVINCDMGYMLPMFTWCILNGNDVYLDFEASGYNYKYVTGTTRLAVDYTVDGFSPGTYAVHFKNKKSEVVCQGTSTSISDFTVKTNHTSTLYDLQGRRLDHEPQHGVFIRDGQKVMK